MKKELATKTIKYDKLDKNLMSALQRKYSAIEKNMLEIASLCYQLKNQDEEQFNLFVENKLNCSKSTITKFIKVGELLENSPVALPNTYTKIYALQPVKEELEDFNSYVESNTGKELKDLSIREINQQINHYNKDGVKSEEVESDEVESVEVESNILNVLKEKLENIWVLANSIKISKVSYDDYYILLESLLELKNMCE